MRIILQKLSRMGLSLPGIGSLLIATSLTAQGAIVFTFTEGGSTATLNPTSDTVATYSAGAMVVGAGLFGTSGLSTGNNSTGAYPDASAGHNWFASSMNASTTVDATTPYLQFTFTPVAGESVVIQRFSFGVRSLASDDPAEKAGSGAAGWPAPTEYAIRSSLDSYGTTVKSGSFPSNKDALWYFYDNVIGGGGLQGAMDQALTVRLYLLDAGTGDRAGAFRIDDVTVSPIPEPGIVALLLGCVTLGMVLIRRRLQEE